MSINKLPKITLEIIIINTPSVPNYKASSKIHGGIEGRERGTPPQLEID